MSWDDDGESITGFQYQLDGGSWTDIPRGRQASSHTVRVDDCQIHTVWVRAVNGPHVGPISNALTAAVVCELPAPPTGLIVEGGRGQVTLRWDDPGDPTVSIYQKMWARSSRWSPLLDPENRNCTGTSCTIQVFDCDERAVRIRAINGLGASPPSDQATGRATTCKPGPVEGLTATAGDGRITLRWKTDPDDEITGYQYKQKVDGRYGDWTDIPGSGPGTTSHTITGTSCDEYEFSIRAVNDPLTSSASSSASAWGCLEPIGLSVSRNVRGLYLSWHNAQDSPTIRYQYRLREAGGTFGDWRYIIRPSIKSGHAGNAVRELAVCQTYEVQVRTVTASGHAYPSGTVTGVTECPPERPTGLTASAGDGQVALSWDDPQTLNIIKYQYRQREGDGAFGDWIDIPIPHPAPGITEHTVTGLNNGETYRFRVRAVNWSGNGRSATVSITLPPTP